MLVRITSILVGSLFVFSGALKLFDPVIFRESVASFAILHVQFFENMLTVLVPALEFLCGLFLISNIFKKTASATLIFLLWMFIIAIGANLVRGNIVDCGCFGPLKVFAEISIWSVAMNIFLIMLLLFVNTKSVYVKSKMSELKPFILASLLVASISHIYFQNEVLAYEASESKMKKISFAMAMNLAEKENGLFVDARDELSYANEHVPGALLFPSAKMTEYYEYFASEDKNRPLLIYCYNPVCIISAKAGAYLMQRGFKNIYIINRGLTLWEK